MNKIQQLLTAMLLCPLALLAQTEQLRVATLNVDGLPKKILVFNVNANGSGDEGTSRIGKYLYKKSYDIVCMQEDFNYHGVLQPWLEDDYQFDAWTGAVGIDLPGKRFDFLHAQNEQFECDGLGTCWKNSIQLTDSKRVAWKQSFGKFSHALDELVAKGYRRSELTLASGARIIVYNMHMDASDLADEKEGKDTPDRAARLSEWRQLLDDVLDHLDTRPIIIMGDLNSYYCRDQIKAEFIDKIAASGKGTASDVWVELQRAGQYPEAKDGIVYTEDDFNILDGETLDKIIYVNPTNGTRLKAVAFNIDKEGYTTDGNALGDHYPVSATFEVLDGRKSQTAIDAPATAAEQPAEYYNLNGRRVIPIGKGVYIERQGQDSHKRIIK